MRMERPQSEPTVWNPSAAALMVANIQAPSVLGYESPSIYYLRSFPSFFSLSVVGIQMRPSTQT